MRQTALLFPLLLLLALSGCVTTKPANSCVSALAAHHKLQIAQAISYYSDCLASPGLSAATQARIKHNRAALYFLEGKTDEGIADLKSVIDSEALTGVSLARTYRLLGIGYRYHADFAKSLESYDRAIELDPTNEKNFSGRAQTHISAEQFKEAIDDYNRAIALEPENTGLVSSRALVNIKAGNLDAGMKDFAEVIRREERPLSTYYSRSLEYNRQREFDKAIADQERILLLSSNDWRAQLSRGQTYLWMRQYDKAIAAFNKLPTPYNVLFGTAERGIALYLKGNFRQAITDLTAAANLNKFNRSAAIWLFIARTRIGENAMVDLATRNKHFSGEQWPKPVIKFLLGQITPDQLLAAARHEYTTEEQIRTCQAHFYIGLLSLFANKMADARKHLSASAATGVPACFESSAAATELERLGHVEPAI